MDTTQHSYNMEYALVMPICNKTKRQHGSKKLCISATLATHNRKLFGTRISQAGVRT